MPGQARALEGRLYAATRKAEHLSNVLLELNPSLNLDNVPVKDAESLRACMERVDTALQAQLDAAAEASQVASGIIEQFENMLQQSCVAEGMEGIRMA
eukprot:scaffold831_cov268-Pinguiococcus_pyrenoidosus.AAC.5